jgi:hypothetical protein
MHRALSVNFSGHLWINKVLRTFRGIKVMIHMCLHLMLPHHLRYHSLYSQFSVLVIIVIY